MYTDSFTYELIPAQDLYADSSGIFTNLQIRTIYQRVLYCFVDFRVNGTNFTPTGTAITSGIFEVDSENISLNATGLEVASYNLRGDVIQYNGLLDARAGDLGHVADTPANRKTILDAVNDESNFLSNTKFGNRF